MWNTVCFLNEGANERTCGTRVPEGVQNQDGWLWLLSHDRTRTLLSPLSCQTPFLVKAALRSECGIFVIYFASWNRSRSRPWFSLGEQSWMRIRSVPVLAIGFNSVGRLGWEEDFRPSFHPLEPQNFPFSPLKVPGYLSSLYIKHRLPFLASDGQRSKKKKTRRRNSRAKPQTEGCWEAQYQRDGKWK